MPSRVANKVIRKVAGVAKRHCLENRRSQQCGAKVRILHLPPSFLAVAQLEERRATNARPWVQLLSARPNITEGWASGLCRHPAKVLSRKGREGSNPSPSAKKVRLAQLVERLPYKQDVGGSTPSLDTKNCEVGEMAVPAGLITRRSSVRIRPSLPLPQCPGGGIGRRTSMRGWRSKGLCGFESRPGHHKIMPSWRNWQTRLP